MINNYGYLLDAHGNIINNYNGALMFQEKDIDDKGEVPGYFSIDKFNFNPHAVRGDFDYDEEGKPIIHMSKKGLYVDRRGWPISRIGYRIDGQGNLIDNCYARKLKNFHMIENEDVPLLFNYDGRKYNLLSVIGSVEKDKFG